MESKYERIRINKIVQGILQGRIKLKDEKSDDKEEEQELPWDLWENKKEDPLAVKMPPSISAPKIKLPDHAESYNPPEE